MCRVLVVINFQRRGAAEPDSLTRLEDFDVVPVGGDWIELVPADEERNRAPMDDRVARRYVRPSAGMRRTVEVHIDLPGRDLTPGVEVRLRDAGYA